MIDVTVWGIHAGKTGDADALFLNNKVIAIGWRDLGDLSLYKDRNAIKQRYIEVYPEKPTGAAPVCAGQRFRFVDEVKPDDYVVYSSKKSKQIYIGKITGDYVYAPEIDSGYPNQRPVEWLESYPRTSFSQGALYELGSAMSLFQVKNYAEEWLSALEKEPTEIKEPDDEPSTTSADEIEDQTRVFVIKQLSKSLKGLPLEGLIAHLLEKMGYNARLTGTNEPSVDIIAHRDELGFEPPIIKVQVKSGAGSISDKDVSALYGKLGKDEYGLFITLGSFTPHAINFDRSKSNLRLIDGSQLVDIIFEYYDHLDAKYKSIIPLKNVYVPEPISE